MIIQNYFDNVKRILGSLTSNARTREGWGFSPPSVPLLSKKIAVVSSRWAETLGRSIRKIQALIDAKLCSSKPSITRILIITPKFNNFESIIY